MTLSYWTWVNATVSFTSTKKKKAKSLAAVIAQDIEFCILSQQKKRNKTKHVLRPRIELGTSCVWGTRDNQLHHPSTWIWQLQWKDHVIDHQSEPSSILIVLALRPALLKGDSTAKIVAGYSHIHCALSLIDWVPPASSSNTLASNLSPNHNSTPSCCVCVVFLFCFV